jgi:ribokinase
MSTSQRCSVVGSINMDIVTRMPRFPNPGETLRGSSFRMYPGGKGANQAVALARLGACVDLIGLLGDDMLGGGYRDILKREGIGADAVRTVEGSATGTASIEVIESGENHIVIVGGVNNLMNSEYVESQASIIQASKTLLLQLEIPERANIAAARIAKKAGATVILDPAPAPSPAHEISPELLSLVDIITPNETEAAILTGIDTSTDEGVALAIKALHARGIGRVIVKAGGKGAWYSDHDHARLVPAFRVQVVDTVAAGDSFNAGLAFALGELPAFTEGEGREFAGAIRFANATAALSTTKEGAQSAMPSLDEVKALLSRYPM